MAEMKLVPVEPTREMIDAGWNDAIQSPESIWRSMVTYAPAASPQAPAREGVEDDLAVQLAQSIAGLGYPVGLGQAPTESDCRKAAKAIVMIYGAALTDKAPSAPAGEGERRLRWAVVHMREVLSRLQHSSNAADFEESRLSGVAIGDDALRARTSEPEAREAVKPHCQLCGGKVEGWTCQTCEASFEEVDGLLVLKSEAAIPSPDETAEKLRAAAKEAVEVMTWLWINHVSGPPAERLATSYGNLRQALAALSPKEEGGK